MQIREMDFKELDVIYEVVSQLREDLSNKEFDDLVYDMRHMEYKMIGLFERGVLITFAGVSIQTNFYHKRHLYISDLVTDMGQRRKGYAKEMMLYLLDYAKSAMCENIVLSSNIEEDTTYKFCEREGLLKQGSVFRKTI